MATLIHTEFGVTHEHPLGGASMTVGRAGTHSILTKDPKASRDQFRIDPGANGYVVSDLGSRNGTRVNDQIIAGPATLKSGDRIAIGAAEFRFVDEEAPGHATVAMETPSAAPGILELVQANRRRLEGVGRALAFVGILLAAASPALGVFLFLIGVIMALLGAFA